MAIVPSVWEKLYQHVLKHAPTPVETTVLGGFPGAYASGVVDGGVPEWAARAAAENGLEILGAGARPGTCRVRLKVFGEVSGEAPAVTMLRERTCRCED